MIERITNKRGNYRVWTSGGFGNRLRSWRTIEHWLDDGQPGPVVLRYLSHGGGFCEYDVPSASVLEVARQWVARGADSRLIMVNESTNDDHIRVQGEFFNDVLDGHVEGFLYSTVRLKMRDALKERSQYVSGPLRARTLLRRAMTPSSWADFEVLIERYPGHVMEVSVYDRCLGDISGRNALVWEVRKY